MDKNSIIGLVVSLCVILFILSEKKEKGQAESTLQNTKKQQFTANYATPLLDGNANDAAWQGAEWQPLDQIWIGTPPSPDDFAGRYMTCWDENNVYIIAEITDDTLVDTHPDGLLNYWDDDCLEIFVDEDTSGGNHQYAYNAFAYHIALDGRTVDLRSDSMAGYFNDHCTVRRVTIGKTTTWEVAVKIFDGKQYTDSGENIPKMLKAGKKLGFALAYCDNDHSAERENFIGSVRIDGEDKNRAWIDAGVFGLLTLL